MAGTPLRDNYTIGIEGTDDLLYADVPSLEPGSIVLVTTWNSEYYLEIQDETWRTGRVIAAGGQFDPYGQVEIRLRRPCIWLNDQLDFHHVTERANQGSTSPIKRIEIVAP